MNNYCKICFKEIKDYSLYNLINKNNFLCEDCFDKLNAKFISFYIGNIKGLSIYEYNEAIKELIYKFKGCYDYELKDVFLARYINYLRFMYRGYTVIPAPSYYIDDQKRGFNHVIEIFKNLKLEMCPIIKKVSAHKQSDHSHKGRANINNVLKIENVDLKVKKILLVDDILTTGSTMLTCIDLIKQKHPKEIKILVIAKTKKKEKEQY